MLTPLFYCGLNIDLQCPQKRVHPCPNLHSLELQDFWGRISLLSNLRSPIISLCNFSSITIRVIEGCSITGTHREINLLVDSVTKEEITGLTGLSIRIPGVKFYNILHRIFQIGATNQVKGVGIDFIIDVFPRSFVRGLLVPAFGPPECWLMKSSVSSLNLAGMIRIF